MPPETSWGFLRASQKRPPCALAGLRLALRAAPPSPAPERLPAPPIAGTEKRGSTVGCTPITTAPRASIHLQISSSDKSSKPSNTRPAASGTTIGAAARLGIGSSTGPVPLTVPLAFIRARKACSSAAIASSSRSSSKLGALRLSERAAGAALRLRGPSSRVVIVPTSNSSGARPRLMAPSGGAPLSAGFALRKLGRGTVASVGRARVGPG
ncbi:hypothetical protein Ctob_002044 [Chrysochromulina tobinii]|uniref:Uncharacterized protein n=1 Tax=Chrysochromulina tobinii TaxID=1460289 RepID=A0A0M0J9H3_9EUKA|nr:hypothetical protein Ctob_002044 [Chrysochromulina tobinii]|eukprot:KOO22873.1 hypothetical protein Ctob_002044 [Chrysochromulina sp. CCMP291]